MEIITNFVSDEHKSAENGNKKRNSLGFASSLVETAASNYRTVITEILGDSSTQKFSRKLPNTENRHTL
jgi:hypothetical protein